MPIREEAMPILRVDRDKCNKDGICVEVCPVSILAMGDESGTGIPAPASGAVTAWRRAPTARWTT